jgi:hypothetical protein
MAKVLRGKFSRSGMRVALWPQSVNHYRRWREPQLNADGFRIVELEWPGGFNV